MAIIYVVDSRRQEGKGEGREACNFHEAATRVENTRGGRVRGLKGCRVCKVFWTTSGGLGLVKGGRVNADACFPSIFWYFFEAWGTCVK